VWLSRGVELREVVVLGAAFYTWPRLTLTLAVGMAPDYGALSWPRPTLTQSFDSTGSLPMVRATHADSSFQTLFSLMPN
jgi:hypothetical protein